ncbi:hypothetical protein BH11ARM2_BH11ARM2_34860 [soil metagenome]
MTRERSAVLSALVKKGFQLKEGDHDFLILHDAQGRKATVNTKLSRGTGHREIGDSLLGLMARQCHLPKSDFIRLIDCGLSGEAYLQKLIDADLVDP